jgi:hypothetical protein
MSRWKPLIACALALCCALAPVAAAAQARDATPIVAPEPAVPSAADTWIGAASAVACGFFARATIATGGAIAGTWVGAVAACGMMIFDALVIEKR